MQAENLQSFYYIFNIRILSAFISIHKVRQYFEARGSELLPAGIPAGRIFVQPVTAVQKAETANRARGTVKCAWKCTNLPGTIINARCAGMTLPPAPVRSRCLQGMPSNVSCLAITEEDGQSS